MGYDRFGRATAEWARAVEEHGGASLTWRARPPSAAEQGWVRLVRSRISRWERALPRLILPFEGIRRPRSVAIVLGDQNGEDAFGNGEMAIYFDVSAMNRLYGAAAKPGQAALLDRIFSHEFTHILQTVWEGKHPQSQRTPLDRALRSLWREGLGNMYSLSSEWASARGVLTPRAQERLQELQPILVERLGRLATASDSGEAELRKGLSSGPFADKWGALPVALWLAEEAGGDGRKLRAWVHAGSRGILKLARKHLPPDLSARLPE